MTAPQLSVDTVDKPVDSNIVSQDKNAVNSSIRNGTENSSLNLTDKCELITTKHTATGDDVWVITLKDKLSLEEYKDLNGKVKAVGGYYSRFAKDTDGKAIPGFVFKTEPTEKEISVFNDFFKKETVATENEKNIAEIQTKSEKVLNNTAENDTINKNEREVNGNGTYARAEVSENDNGFGKMQTKEQAGGICERVTAERAKSGGTLQTDTGVGSFADGRVGKIETRKLSDVIEDSKFEKISKFVGNELSMKKSNELLERYDDDSRLNDGYEFPEMVAYDMLTDTDNELRSLFADNIAEEINTVAPSITSNIEAIKKELPTCRSVILLFIVSFFFVCPM